jgi:aspartyl/asparaginyl beta-hydroxylase (cupin superfamily)
MIRAIMEKCIARLARDGERTFFEADRFPWVAALESNWLAIRDELNDLLRRPQEIPNFQDISKDQEILTEGEQWKTFFFYAYGHHAERNCARCPQTTRLLARIPGMKTAMFSILAPGKHIPEHRGPYNGVLRYHLGLIVPEPEMCRIRVGNDTRIWYEGKSLIFDDSHLHEVWNDSNSHRTVLFVDFLRPLPFPLSILNRVMIWKISTTPFITTAIQQIRKAEPAAVPRSTGL